MKKIVLENVLEALIDRTIQEKHMGFDKLKRSLAHQKGVTNPGAVAASIGRKKYGDQAMQHAAETGHELKENPMDDIGKEAESNYLVRDILTTMGEDEKVRQEIMDALGNAQTPEEKDQMNTALGIITKTIREKEGLMQILSKSKPGMPEAKDPLKAMVDEAVKQVMTEKAPPGLEDMVLALKKKYGEDSPRPFQIAWARYNKKHK